MFFFVWILWLSLICILSCISFYSYAHSHTHTLTNSLLWSHCFVVIGIYIVLEWLFVIGIAWWHSHRTVLSWSYWAWESWRTSTRVTWSEDIVQVRHTNWWRAFGWGLKIHQRNRSSRNCSDLDWLSKWLDFYLYDISTDLTYIIHYFFPFAYVMHVLHNSTRFNADVFLMFCFFQLVW